MRRRLSKNGTNETGVPTSSALFRKCETDEERERPKDGKVGHVAAPMRSAL